MGEQGSLLSAGAAADLDNDILVVVFISRQQQDLQLLLQLDAQLVLLSLYSC